MAVTEVEERPEASGGWDRLWRRTYLRHYRVECDSRTDDEVTIRTALLGGNPWLPRIGAAFPTDVGAFLTDVQYTRKNLTPDGCEWDVSCKYEPYDGGTFGSNPVSWPLRAAFTSQKYERPITADQGGVPILNSAACPFEEPVVVDDSRSIITVVRNERIGGTPGFDMTLAETYRDKINNAVWNGFAAKTVKCTSITTSQPQYDSNAQVYFYEVTYIFELNRDKWQKVILDQGYQKLDGSNFPTPITNDGKAITEPALLNGSGQPLASTGTPVFLTFDVYPSADFSVFNIDLSTALGK